MSTPNPFLEEPRDLQSALDPPPARVPPPVSMQVNNTRRYYFEQTRDEWANGGDIPSHLLASLSTACASGIGPTQFELSLIEQKHEELLRGLEMSEKNEKLNACQKTRCEYVVGELTREKCDKTKQLEAAMQTLSLTSVSIANSLSPRINANRKRYEEELALLVANEPGVLDEIVEFIKLSTNVGRLADGTEVTLLQAGKMVRGQITKYETLERMYTISLWKVVSLATERYEVNPNHNPKPNPNPNPNPKPNP
jgi:hypothetical protein